MRNIYMGTEINPSKCEHGNWMSEYWSREYILATLTTHMVQEKLELHIYGLNKEFVVMGKKDFTFNMV